MCGGGVPRSCHLTLAALVLLSFDGIDHDVDARMQLHGYQTGAEDAGNLRRLQDAAHLADVAQLLAALLQFLAVQDVRPGCKKLLTCY